MKITKKFKLNQIKGFFSYKNTDKIYAGKIKASLERYGIDVFLAHEDIKVSKEWDEEILKALKNCDFVLLLLTKNFQESEYTDQETGIAIGLEKKIIPIKVDETDPYGFIDKLQALKLHSDDIDKSCEEIIRLIKDEPKLKKRLNDSLVMGIVKSKSFKECNSKCSLLPPLDQLNRKHIISLVNYGIDNPQFYNSDEGKKILDIVENKYLNLFEKETIGKILERIKKCKFRVLPGFVFRKRKPAVFGVEILAGVLKPDVPIRKEDGEDIGKIKNIEKEGKIIPEARTGDKVAVSMEEPIIGRQINEGDILIAY